MEFFETNDRDDLISFKEFAEEGDLAIVEDGAWKRVYIYKLGEWFHNDGYCCPVRIRENEDEPNV